MNTRQVSASWTRGPLRCDVEVEGYVVAVDEPPSAGGTGKGPQPTDLFLASIASCFTLALAYSADRMGVILENVKVDVVGHYAGMRFAAIDIRALLGCAGEVDLELLVRGAERVCYVTNTLRTAPTINVALDPSPS